jgi:flagellar basal body-associated protein FliL
MDKSKMMMIVIIALLVLLLGTVVGVGVYLISLADDDVTRFETPADPNVTQITMPGDMTMISLDSVIANLALGPNNRSDNVVTNVYVGIDRTRDEEEYEEFYEIFMRSLSIARAEVLNVLVSRTYDEVRTLEGRLETGETIKLRLQEVFGSNLIVYVTFSEWHAVRGR